MNETPMSTALKRRRQQTSPILGNIPYWQTYDADLIDNYRSTKRYASNNTAEVSVSFNEMGLVSQPMSMVENSPLVGPKPIPTSKKSREGNHMFETPGGTLPSPTTQQQHLTSTATMATTTSHRSTPQQHHQYPPSSPMSLGGDADVLPHSPSDSHVDADLDLRKTTLVRLLYLRQQGGGGGGAPGPSPLGTTKALPPPSLYHHQPYNNNAKEIEQRLEFTDPIQTEIAHPATAAIVNNNPNTIVVHNVDGDSLDIYKDENNNTSARTYRSSKRSGTNSSMKQRQASHWSTGSRLVRPSQ